MNNLKHIAIITDGNGRWATQRGRPRSEGHTAGRQTFEQVCNWCIEAKIPFLSFFVLSLDNLKRDKAELEHINQLARELCNPAGIARAKERGIRLCLCGDRSMQDPADLALFEEAERETAECEKLTVMLQGFYGGRAEICQAAQRCVRDGVEISEDNISARLYAAPFGHTDPDLIIRTGGYQRLSGYLPWESVYSELYFTHTLFPDLSREEFMWACKWFAGIHRTHGGDRDVKPVQAAPAAPKGGHIKEEALAPKASKGNPFARKGQV